MLALLGHTTAIARAFVVADARPRRPSRTKCAAEFRRARDATQLTVLAFQRLGTQGRSAALSCLMSTLTENEAMHPLQGRKILIVEDEAPIALNLAAAV